MTEENPLCPKCSTPVSPEDTYCERCGTWLKNPRFASTSTPTPAEFPSSQELTPPSPPTQPYERKYGMFSRLIRVLYKPSETMKDIAMAPDYGGVVVIIVAQIAVNIITVAYELSKISITGSYASLVYVGLLLGLVAGSALTFILLPAKWLVKSLLVRKLGDAGSGWAFKSAASVTGYAYIANLVLSLVTLPISIYFFPTLNIETGNIEAAGQWLASYQSQLTMLKFVYTLPSLFVTLLWKSYLGALGTIFGTKQMCKISRAFSIFFLLGLISLAISVLS